MIERHRAPNVVPERRRVRPVAADRLERLRRVQRSLSADEHVLRSFLAGRTVTCRAATRIHVLTRTCGATPRWKTAAIGQDFDVDRLQFVRCRRTADAEGR